MNSKFSKHDENERQAFELIKLVPFVGYIYRIGRAITYGCRGEKNEVRHALTFDLSNLNPFIYWNSFTKAVSDLNSKYDEGIWIGKRALARSIIGFNLKMKFDFWHYAIMIDGVVYEILKDDKDDKEQKKMKLKISEEVSVKKEFKWSNFDFLATNVRTREEIKKESEYFIEKNNYYLLPKEEDKRQNCQTYVFHIYKFVTGLNDGFAKIVLKSGLSTGFTGGKYDKEFYVKHVMTCDDVEENLMSYNPKYKTEESRIESFTEWPKGGVIRPIDFAKAGFYFTKEKKNTDLRFTSSIELFELYLRKEKCKDLIACFACGIRLVVEDDDDADE